jgi:DNA-directed RNA polymerase specialized sigma24 family protein
MFHVEGYSAPQISTEIGAPRGTVYTWIHSAARDIRASLARRDAAERSGVRPRK